MEIPKLSDIKLNRLYIEKHHPDFFKYIMDTYANYSYIKFTELLYCIYNNIIDHPKCPICNKNVPFLDFNRGYQKYCSLKCSNKSPEVQERKKQSNVEKFGVEHAAQSDMVKKKIIETTTEKYGGMGNASKSIKSKQYNTMKIRYGSEHALQNEEFKTKAINTTTERYGGIGLGSEILKEKINNTNLERYGVVNPLRSKEIREKIKQSNMDKYGCEYATQNEEISNKIKLSKYNKLLSNNPNILSSNISDDGYIVYTIKCPHLDCNKCSEKSFNIRASYYQRRLDEHTEPCTNLLPIQKSNSKNTSLEIFIKNILDKHNISYIENDRIILGGKELDIYIPNKKIAIECNGIYWHSIKEPNYHRNKYDLCESKGIQLLNIWQDWIINKPEIVESIILSKLGIYNDKIYARKCKVKEITNQECIEFLNRNHIQGAGSSQIKLGLYYNDRLVSVMTFSLTNRFGKKNEQWYYDLTRFCSLLNTQVLGATGKLLQYFIDNYHPIRITSFACRDISNGKLYESLKFQNKGINKSYWYVDKYYNRFHRNTFTKSSIIKRGWAEPNKQWKEKDIMYEHGYFQIYDSGQIKYILE